MWLSGENGWRAPHFAALRALLGVYLVGHYATLLPWAAEVFSNQGMLPDAAASPIFGLMPTAFLLSDAPSMAVAHVLVGLLAGIGLAGGFFPRVCALVAWFVGAALLARNPLILSPALPHVGWLLLWVAAIRSPTAATDPDWRLDPAWFRAGWLLMGTAMAWSAFTKLGSVSWLDGSALTHVWSNPLARDTALRPWLLALPGGVVKALTWGTLGVEALALVAALQPRLRPAVWTALLAMHLGLLVTVDFADLTLGMLVVHMALFDPAWLRHPTVQGLWGRTTALLPRRARV